MIISIRTVGEVWNPVTKELDYTASFSLAFKRKGRREVKVSNVFVDIYNPQPDHTQLVFHNFYAALKRRFKLSDFRLFYVDEDNDHIPIDHNLEFVDAVKYASKNLPSKTIQLIIVVGEPQIPEYDRQHSGQACVVVERVMPPISVENVFLSDQSAEERTSEERTAKRFRDFLEAHKKEIVAEVTKQIYLKFAKELGLKSVNSINDPANAGIHYRENSNRTNQLHKPNDGSNVNDPNADKLSIMRQRSNWRRRQKSPSPPPRQEPRMPQNETLNIPLRPPVTMASEEYYEFPITNQSTSALKTTPPKDTPKNENLCLPKKSNILSSDKAESLAQLDSSNFENSENQQANDEQIELANDNISILSNSSNMSDFVIEDGDFLEGAMANSPRLRHSSSSSSFEIVSEPSPEPPSFDLNEDSLPIDETKNSTKNIAQSSEQEKKEDETLILPELNIRPGGTYSFDTSTLLDASEQTTPKEVEKPIGPSTHSEDSKNLKKNKVEMVKNKEVGANSNSNGQSSTGLRGIHSHYLTYGRQTLYMARIRAQMAKAGLGKRDYIPNYDDEYGGFSIDEDDDGDVDNDNKDDDDDDDDEEYRRLLKFTGFEPTRPPNRYISSLLAAKKRKDDESSDSTSEGRRAEVKMEKSRRGNSRVVEIKHIGKTASPPNSGARIDHNVSKGLGDTKKTSGNTSTMTRQSHASSSSERQHETRSHSYGYPEFSTTYNRGLRTPSQSFHDDQCSERYDRYSNAMQILPEPLISGALQAASRAYITARTVIEKIRSPLTDEQGDTKPPGSS